MKALKRKDEGGAMSKYRISDVSDKEYQCPLCEMDMLVSDNSFVGLDMNDEQVEIIGVRGI